MQRIAIVTDSTADFPLTYYEENDVYMVPLTVRFGTETYKDWVEMPPEEFYPRLKNADELPKTSQPSIQEFFNAYNKYKDFDHIISVHISSRLSGTCQAASIAAQSSPAPVTVIDSRTTTGGLGLIINELVKARQDNKTHEELVAIAQRMIDSTKVVFYLDTLKYLEMGGRIGKAQALAGSLLDIKPILTFDDGMVAPLKKTRGRKKAMREIAAYVYNRSGGKNINVALQYAGSPRLLEELEANLKAVDISYNPIIRSQIGCVIGTYAGPDAAVVFFYPGNIPG